ncbi:hypothetical protein V5N11_026890 [Cardamine amara subsp. amara]|uniref:Uncharacterized protein n=1 Tax=Cardamine amara subsp. amara TaxID=228776 RepID=A0ABD0ZHQ4_CARAN
MIVQLTGGKLTLRFIHHNRENFLQGLQKNMNDICSRAFDGIWGRAEMYNREKRLALEREKAIEEMQQLRLTTTAQQGSTSRLSVRQETTLNPSIHQETFFRPSGQQETIFRPMVRQDTTVKPSIHQQTIFRPIVRQETIDLPPPPVEGHGPSMQGLSSSYPSTLES